MYSVKGEIKMYKIVRKKELNPTVTLMDIEAPLVAQKAQPGQFIIVKLDEQGERIPLTICDYDREKGTITIVFQPIGQGTQEMAKLQAGDAFEDSIFLPFQ